MKNRPVTFWSQFLQEPHNLYLSVPLSSDLQLSELHFCRVGKPMNPALTHHMPVLFLTSSHRCSLSFRSTLSHSLVLSPRSDAWFIVSQWLSEEIGDRNPYALLFFSLPVFISSLCQEEANCSWSPKSWVYSKLHPIFLSAIPWSQKGEHLSWDLIWNYSSRKGGFSPSHLKKLTRDMG